MMSLWSRVGQFPGLAGGFLGSLDQQLVEALFRQTALHLLQEKLVSLLIANHSSIFYEL
jgi:hypothetical protein